jgi:hypothetical protein
MLADTLIVKTALQVACDEPVIVVATDTDILVTLVYHVSDCHIGEFMLLDSKQTKLISIKAVHKSSGSIGAKRLPFVHAVSGCDSTSSLYGHGKVIFYKKLATATEFSNQKDTFGSISSSYLNIVEAGMPILTAVYGRKANDSLDRLRYLQYFSLTATSSVRLRPERLPPTNRAATFHLYRVH